MIGTALVPVEQRSIDFYGDELIAMRTDDSTIWVPIRHLCDALGVERTAQMRRIERDPVLNAELRNAPVTLPDGRTFEMACLPLKYVRGWLFGINTNRVKEEIRDKLIQYQREVIEIIDRHFGRPIPADSLDETMMEAMRDNAIKQAQLWEALIAEQRRLRAAEAYLAEVDDRLGDHDRTLWAHERALNELRSLQQEQSQTLTRLSDTVRLLPAPEGAIDAAQKAAIKALVDDLVAAAQQQGIRLGQGRNDYPAVWDAFKRRFDLARYDELTVSRYEEAVSWLKTWLDRVRNT
jgi:hypothetical protein